MNLNATCTWTGASGQQYTYHVYQLPQSFNTGQAGNYIFTRDESGIAPAIYIGEGDLGERISANHHKWTCIQTKGATQVHVHLNADETARKQEEADLLAGNPEAYVPTGCNEA
jgi:hypothetical protein